MNNTHENTDMLLINIPKRTPRGTARATRRAEQRLAAALKLQAACGEHRTANKGEKK